MYISADKLRVKHENESFYVCLAVLFILIFVFSVISAGLFLLLVALTMIGVKLAQAQLLGNSVRVDAKQFPEVSRAGDLAAKRLAMDRPDVFIIHDPYLNAYAMGFVSNFSVVLHSSLVESMTSSQLLSILGHEFTHIKCNHTSWSVFVSPSEKLKIPIISFVLEKIFLLWNRRCEYTSDRGGLVASQNIKSFIISQAMLAVGPVLVKKMNLKEIFKQKDVFDESVMAKISEVFSTHPYFVNRISEIMKYYNSDEYKSVAHGSDQENTETQIISESPNHKVVSKTSGYNDDISSLLYKARSGDPVAQHKLGVIYANGRGVKQSYVQSYAWLYLSVEAGNKKAEQNKILIKSKLSSQQAVDANKLINQRREKIGAIRGHLT